MNIPAFNKNTSTEKLGFTLIELIIVVVILGILATIALGGFRSSQVRARDAQRKSDLKQIANALELFYSDYEKYPDSSNGNIVSCDYESADPPSSSSCSWGGSVAMQDDKGTVYFRELPGDPGSSSYYYRVLNSNSAFQLYARLENPEDQDCLDNASLPGVPDCDTPTLPTINIPDCGTLDCNFAITSANVNASEDGI